jgi:hypothetical protein
MHHKEKNHQKNTSFTKILHQKAPKLSAPFWIFFQSKIVDTALSKVEAHVHCRVECSCQVVLISNLCPTSKSEIYTALYDWKSKFKSYEDNQFIFWLRNFYLYHEKQVQALHITHDWQRLLKTKYLFLVIWEAQWAQGWWSWCWAWWIKMGSAPRAVLNTVAFLQEKCQELDKLLNQYIWSLVLNTRTWFPHLQSLQRNEGQEFNEPKSYVVLLSSDWHWQKKLPS